MRGGGATAEAQPPLTARLALIAGTSTCHMASSAAPTYVGGVWGPYYGAMLPGLYLNEGGQSAAGALLDHLIQTHAAYPALSALAESDGVPPSIWLNGRLEQMGIEQAAADGAIEAKQKRRHSKAREALA